MERKRKEGLQSGSGDPEVPLRRKPYTSPELQEWGSIQDLTQGSGLDLQDFPLKGGSRPT